jgi:hypothetical protein
MNSLRRLTLCMALLIPVVAHAGQFGDEPLTDVLLAAQQNNNCTSLLTTNRLAALVLTVTWPEVTGNITTLTPSPMTMGRADNSTALYYQGLTNGPYRRAFWHPGMGAWQMDDIGLGSRMAVEKFNTANASAQAASTISSRYCTTATLDYALAPWVACKTSTGNCTTIFNGLFQSPNTFISPTRDATTTRLGGVKARTCQRPGSTATFPCWYVNYNNAEGYKGTWVYAFDATPPLSHPFYIFSETISGTTYEWRHWLSADTGYDIDIAAKRTYGVNSRSGMVWSTGGLCDLTAARGACSTTNYTLSVSKSGSGTGTVKTGGTGIDCGVDCSESYPSGKIATLTAYASSGSSFISWSGCDTVSSTTCNVTLNSNRTVIATFSNSTYYTATTAKTGTGTGLVRSGGSGIYCGTDCSESYPSAKILTLYATADSGSTFNGWSGGCSPSNTSPCNVTMTGNKTITATFTATAQPPRERIVNGSFSSGAANWVKSGDFWIGTNLSNYRTSPGYSAGGVDSTGQPKNFAYGSMYQSVVIPSNATTATFDFWLNITSEDTGAVANDYLYVTLQDSGGSNLTGVCTASNLHRRTTATDYYWHCPLDLIAYKGRTVRVNFLATSNGSLRTTFRIDDVSVIANGN